MPADPKLPANSRRSSRTWLLAAIIFPAVLMAVHAGGARAAIAHSTQPSGFLTIYETGSNLTANEHAGGIAFGDVDGDGLDEMLVARVTTAGARVLLIDDAAADFALLQEFGTGWEETTQATAVALGDADGDGRAEIAIARSVTGGPRVYLFDDTLAGYTLLRSIGASWPSSAGATAVAFGNIDGDVAAEFAAGNDGTSGPRLIVYDDAGAGFNPLWDAGTAWGEGAKITDVAFGDVDGDGLDEVGFTREHPSNDRVFLNDGLTGAPRWTYGADWGAGAWATGIAFGNLDDDPADEMGVARRSGVNERAFLFDDESAGFAELAAFGDTWNEFAYATDIAFGDVDGDEQDEVGLAREATINQRFFIYDDGLAGFALLWGAGETWPGEDAATSIAFGRVNRSPTGQFGVTRRAAEGWRAAVYLRAWTISLPVVSFDRTEPPPGQAR